MATSTTTMTHPATSSLAPDTLRPPPTSAPLTHSNNNNPRGRFHPPTDHIPPSPDPEPAPDPEPEPPHRLPPPPLPKLLSTGLSFFVAGVNDGSLGALIPHLLASYGITTALVSALYAATLAGWLVAALTSTHLGQRLRLGSMLALGAGLQASAHALRCWPPAPPFAVYVVTFFLVSLGQAYQDTFGNTFVASLGGVDGGGEGGGGRKRSVHRWLGFIHAMYMAGCLVAPFAAASVAATGKWYLFYTVPLGLGVVNLGLVLTAFRDLLGFEGRKKRRAEMEAEGKKSASSLVKDALSLKSVWLLGLFFFFYLGAAVTASGWVVEYLVVVRNGDVAKMGYVPAGYSGGSLLGRILLPEPTYRFGEKKMVLLYCVFCLGFQLVFWLVPDIIAASVAISLFGFFSGPLFATALSVGARLFPPNINATAISFVFVFAQIGGSLFPIVTGVLGTQAGVSVMQPILVSLVAAMTISWLLVPQPKGKTK